MPGARRANEAGHEPPSQLVGEYAQRDRWTIEQGVYLAYATYPDVLTKEAHGESFKPPALTNEQVQFVIRANKAVKAGELEAQPTPKAFLFWAHEIGLQFHSAWLRGIVPDEAQGILAARREAFLIKRWALAPTWTLIEGIALSMQVPPSFVPREQDIRQLPDEMGVEGMRRYEFALRANKQRQLRNNPTPRDFLDWATTVGFAFSKAWDEAVPKSAKEADDQARAPKSKDGNLGTRERDTLLKLVIGMAIAGYKYDPQADRNPSTKEISDDLHSLGIGLDPDTVRKWLREGSQLLPGKENKNLGPRALIPLGLAA